MPDATRVVHAWRHPRPRGAAGRCVGARTDLAVDPRKAKRLAHRIRAHARRTGTLRLVVTSPLRRCHAVGLWLARWGWPHRVEARLLELDFGEWDGRAWTDVPQAEIDAWVADFADRAPGGGESVAALLQRVSDGLACLQPGCAVVTHGGWLSAAQWLDSTEGRQAGAPSADRWPAAPAYGAHRTFSN